MHKALSDALETAKDPQEEPSIPDFPYGNGKFTIDKKNGIFFVEKDDEISDKTSRYICSWLIVTALTRGVDNKAWGRLLRWEDKDEKFHEWACPMDLFGGDCAELRAELLRGGLIISSARVARDLLAAYIQNYPTKLRARCVEKLGWFNGLYVLPDKSIGGVDSEKSVFQNPNALEPAFSTSGTVLDWRVNIAEPAKGNAYLTFSLSAAFGGPLLDVADVEGGGFHYCSPSTTGKTTICKAAASVHGKPSEYVRSWRSTSNALEGTCLLHNDGTLILDELSQLDPRAAGEVAYMISNGTAKARANRNATTKKTATWRVLFLSSGEESFVDLARRAGQRLNAGAEIRVAEINADAGKDMGCFENLHGYKTPGQFADSLRLNAEKYYGAVGLEFLKQFVEKRKEFAETIRQSINNFVSCVVPEGASGQIVRVARRFGLVAAAGELATNAELTGWENGAAIHAATVCFKSWLENFGTGDREATMILAQVKAFFEAHGTSRFQDADVSDDSNKIINRAGFFKLDGFGDERKKTFMVLPESFKREVCFGINVKTAIKMLIGVGWLEPDKDGPTQKPRIIAMNNKPTRVYILSSEKMMGA